MAVELDILAGGDQQYIDDLVEQHRVAFAEAMSVVPQPHLNEALPWYLGDDMERDHDQVNADIIAANVWKEFELCKHFGWATDYERFVVSKGVERTVFRGIYYGRVIAGTIIDSEVEGGD